MSAKATAICENAKATFQAAIPVFRDVNCTALPQLVADYIVAHPALTAAEVACIVLALIPGALTGPVLAILGFSGIGPTAGSLAALFQSVYGTVPAFAFLQGAAMNGAAAGILNGAVTGAAALGAGVAEALKWCGTNTTAK